MLLGMAVTFAGIATLAAVGGAWAVRVNHYGRVLALGLLTVFALTLLSNRLADWIARPFVALGNRLIPADVSSNGRNGVASSLVLGGATGLLWAPCAGPVLGLVLTGAALSGPNAHTTLLLFAYAAGACTSLGVALLAGGRVFAAMKRSLGAGVWIRRAFGVATLLAVAAIASGWDGSVLTRLSLAGTNRVEQSLLDKLQSSDAPGRGSDGMPGISSAKDLPIQGELPSLGGATAWLNSAPLVAADLRGKVVLVDFWTYSCINCLRTLPYVKAWYEKYRDHGLVVVGVHTPEFAFEKEASNVEHAVADLHIGYPVALDDDYAIWRAFDNHYWPAHYFIDAAGKIRAHHFAEGSYAESENVIRQLLIEAGQTNLPPAGAIAAPVAGVEAAADPAAARSPETYLGYRRAENFHSPGGFAKDVAHPYSAPSYLDTNEWALSGTWAVDREKAVLRALPGGIEYRFAARDLHLVLGPDVAGKPVRFRVLLDGHAPGPDHGSDVDAGGEGVVTGQRLYQLIRESTDVAGHTFAIEFLDEGVQAYAFTFG
jgi:cytochrome c biogenesis protein CcdA/thiol-disulfide isomerase/thioredoxin